LPESQRQLRRKRKIVTDIRQITGAMKLVSAAKLRRTLARRETADFYWTQLRETVEILAMRVGDVVRHPYLQQRPVQRLGMLVIGGEKGLCGAYNASIVAAASEAIGAAGLPAEVVLVGGRTGDLARRAGLNVTRQFPGVNDKEAWRQAVQITQHLHELYTDGGCPRIDVAYARFISRVSHRAVVESVLPLDLPPVAEHPEEDYLFEPEPEQLLVDLLPRFLRTRVYRLLLDAAASEHSARLMAMTAATDSADDMIEQLTRLINRARQQDITRELLDVVSGADALAQRV